jgi:hypothetical protein
VSGPDVTIRIDELLIRGLAPGDRERIGWAAEIELARLIREVGPPGTAGHGRDVIRADGGAVQLSVGSRADAVGRQIARAVYRSLR